MGKPKFEMRDVSLGLQKLRDFLLGRKYKLHGRFPPQCSSRTVPQPDIPRGPEYKYSNQYYFQRSPFRAIKPPVIAPIAEGLAVKRGPPAKSEPGGNSSECVSFCCAPTPGPPWWWDGHCYYEGVPDADQACGKECKPN